MFLGLNRKIFTTRFKTYFILSSFFLNSCSNNIQSLNNDNKTEFYTLNLPDSFPEPYIPEENKLTKPKVKLGRYLFYDKNLSIDKTVSCGTCHIQSKAFTDGRKVAIGINNSIHSKNSMSLTNIVYNTSLTWANPNLDKLETQMLIPIFGETPPEMGMSGKENILIQRIKEEKIYSKMFKRAFPNENEPFNINNITKAIASFQRTLISSNSRYDKKLMSEESLKGQKLFFSEKLECFHCHGGFNFSGETRRKNTTFIEKEFHNNGLYNIDENGNYPNNGRGLIDITLKKTDMGKFKAPTLRNIELTAPYMHDGSIETLEEVIEHYSRGGRIIHSGDFKGDGKNNPYKSGFVKGFNISEQEKKELIEFLKSLTDQEFISNKEFSDPFQ
ncbi:MAG: di-heme enzyme [Candidatus Sericytochromatia bacterium]